MNFKISFFLIPVCVLFFSLTAHSQIGSLSIQNLSSVKVDEIPDSEIKSYLVKANENGISEENMYRILGEKGLPQEELDKLKNRIANLSTTGSGRNSSLPDPSG